MMTPRKSLEKELINEDLCVLSHDLTIKGLQNQPPLETEIENATPTSFINETMEKVATSECKHKKIQRNRLQKKKKRNITVNMSPEKQNPVSGEDQKRASFGGIKEEI